MLVVGVARDAHPLGLAGAGTHAAGPENHLTRSEPCWVACCVASGNRWTPGTRDRAERPHPTCAPKPYCCGPRRGFARRANSSMYSGRRASAIPRRVSRGDRGRSHRGRCHPSSVDGVAHALPPSTIRSGWSRPSRLRSERTLNPRQRPRPITMTVVQPHELAAVLMPELDRHVLGRGAPARCRGTSRRSVSSRDRWPSGSPRPASPSAPARDPNDATAPKASSGCRACSRNTSAARSDARAAPHGPAGVSRITRVLPFFGNPNARSFTFHCSNT
jgi:hypothetical protein